MAFGDGAAYADFVGGGVRLVVGSAAGGVGEARADPRRPGTAVRRIGDGAARAAASKRPSALTSDRENRYGDSKVVCRWYTTESNVRKIPTVGCPVTR